MPDLVIGDFGVDLGRGNVFMPEHFREGFKRHSVLKADRGSIGMPPCVKGELFVYAAFTGNIFKTVVDGIEGQNLKKRAIACQTSILIQNEQRIGQQRDDIFRLGFLTVTADPPIAVCILLQLIIGQRRHVSITDTRKARKEKQIPIIVLALITQAGCHHAMQFFFSQETPIRIQSRIAI